MLVYIDRMEDRLINKRVNATTGWVLHINLPCNEQSLLMDRSPSHKLRRPIYRP